ncbi:LPS assembly lipoprotein LptE [Roseivivax sp. CAU 1761]
MSSCDRRRALAALAGAALAAGLAGCGFAPAYGPGGGAGALLGRVAPDQPEGRPGYLLVRRLEERLGRATAPAYRLAYEIDLGQSDLGTTSTGTTTRFRRIGSVSYRLIDAASGAELLSDRVESFTGYSATGSSVATLAAERDALERLMTILADRIVDHLVVAAADLP